MSFEAYCLADPLYFELPIRKDIEETGFVEASQSVPVGWERLEKGFWLVMHPIGVSLPAQGWKIHISSSFENCAEIVSVAWKYCVANQLSFKFLPGRTTMLVQNSKYAHRGLSGKLVTIYTTNEAELERTLVELGALLEGNPGPYILTDLRYGSGPLYVRYGGFIERYCWADDGLRVLAIEEPGGRLVPDPRLPAFRVPSWVSVPEFLVPHVEARNQATVDELPYRIDHVMHFSNAGGVYLAIDDATGEKVVLKEARPYAGLDLAKSDAITRLGQERKILERLAGIEQIPALRGFFHCGGHDFLAMEYVEGKTLQYHQAIRSPIINFAPSAEDLADYATWALNIHRQITEIIAAIHDRGVVFGDLHPRNVLIDDNDIVRLIDFELASDDPENHRSVLGAPGFMAPIDRTGFDADRCALASLGLALFFPLTAMVNLDLDKLELIVEEIARWFPVPDSFLTEALSTLMPPERPAEPERPGTALVAQLRSGQARWDDLRESMVATVVDSATPHREDRLFPCDFRQFAPGGSVSLAFGATGVLYALASVGAERLPDCEAWLVRTVRRQAELPAGLYDGLHGVAHTLDLLGLRADALAVLDRALDTTWQQADVDLYGGLAGMGLNLAHLATSTGEAALEQAACQAVDIVAERFAESSFRDVTRSRPGLMHGWSGPALLFIRWYERTGDGQFLDMARAMVQADLDRCRMRDDDSLHTNVGWRLLCYLADGSAGIGCVIQEYLRHRQDDDLLRTQEAIARAARTEFYVQSDLFNGRAGLLLYQARDDHSTAREAAQEHVRRLSWHAVPRGDGLAFPGEGLLRLSMDLATGLAGVLLALGRAYGKETAELPFLGRHAYLAPQPASAVRMAVG